MISISLPPSGKNWTRISFASTLYLHPILDILLSPIPFVLHDEVRLGLQEALVNAVRHGNNLDPGKTICVQFSASKNNLLWIISDQGLGEVSGCPCNSRDLSTLPSHDSENGRGLYILKRVFDQVFWDSSTGQLTLCKKIKKAPSGFMTVRTFVSRFDHVLGMAARR